MPITVYQRIEVEPFRGSFDSWRDDILHRLIAVEFFGHYGIEIRIGIRYGQ